tara:strand:+ start:954 stop:1472 length:519 start_codon:yes stop_codon:yes gene_type:complete
LKSKLKKVGILGGTFDPPHIGHLNISKIALKKLKLDNLLWIVTKQNPLKGKPYLSIKTRLYLSRKITKNHKKIYIKCLDKKIKSKNTYNLLNYFKNKNKKLFFIIGADNLIKFHKWKNWEKISKISKIIVFARPNYSIKALKSVAAKKMDRNDWMFINSKKTNISSSLIRKL